MHMRTVTVASFILVIVAYNAYYFAYFYGAYLEYLIKHIVTTLVIIQKNVIERIPCDCES